jgi:hypothetical protein
LQAVEIVKTLPRKIELLSRQKYPQYNRCWQVQVGVYVRKRQM